MTNKLTLIGFGEAAQAFCGAAPTNPAWGKTVCSAFDIKTDQDQLSEQKYEDYAQYGIHGKATLKDAVENTDIILCLVTADQALNAAREACLHLKNSVLYFDMNSVAPTTKSEAGKLIEQAGGRYVDVAIMAPVDPARLSVPLLVCGSHQEEALNVLNQLGFTNTKQVGAEIGRASSIKMIRSVMIKGLEALTAECVFAAYQADVLPEIMASLGEEWADKADYNFDRMMIHGQRRASEMREVSKTLQDLGVKPLLTAGTVKWQDRIGKHGLTAPQVGLNNKLLQILTTTEGESYDLNH